MDKNSSLLISYSFYWFDSHKDRYFLHSLRQFEMHPALFVFDASACRILGLESFFLPNKSIFVILR